VKLEDGGGADGGEHNWTGTLEMGEHNWTGTLEISLRRSHKRDRGAADAGDLKEKGKDWRLSRMKLIVKPVKMKMVGSRGEKGENEGLSWCRKDNK